MEAILQCPDLLVLLGTSTSIAIAGEFIVGPYLL